MKGLFFVLSIVSVFSHMAVGQVDTSFIYNESTPYGVLDLRLSRSSTNYYYLQEGKTFSFRTDNGQRTNTYLHLTSWDTESYDQGQLREKTATSDKFVMNYRLLAPEGYRSDVEYPIVLFLHGLAESGNCADERCHHADRNYDPNVNSPPAPTDATHPLYNNDYNLLHGGRNYLNARNRAGTLRLGDPSLDSRAFPGFALFPQSNNGWSPSEVENALRILRLIMKKYKINRNRVYINGLSKGGYGAFEALKRAPWLFAAGAMFSPIHDASINALNLAPSIQHVPLWIFQGGQDLAPLPRDTEERIRRFRTAGLSVRYTIYPQIGHATWNEALQEPDFFSWLLGYSNTSIHAFGGSEAICESTSDGLTLTLPPGYAQYEWQLNQKTISISGNHSLVVKQSGVYRARFKFVDTGQWNEWSKEINIGLSSPAEASFVQRGTLHLPDLNGNNDAIVEAVGDYNHYYWYRYEDLIDFPGDVNDTFKIARIEPYVGSGYISLKVGDYGGCISPPSEERKIFFYGKSPVVISPPSSLKLESRSSSQVTVSWEDKSSNEAGFEIWRRPINPSGPWVMSAITDANAKSFTDTKLSPATKYEYKIRAVSNEGRSEYFPATGTSLTVETPPDKNPPAKPYNLNGELTDVNTITVWWNPANDDSSIKQYVLHVNGQEIKTGNADTTYVLHQLSVNTTYRVQVAAIDAGDNVGEKSSTISVSTEMTGLFYKHTTGAWNDLNAIDWTHCEYSGRVPYFDLSPRRQEDFFNFRFDGFLYIRRGGDYQFRLSSNDGSRLRLNDTLVVNNDGIHEVTSVESAVRTIKTGPHRVTVDFFDFMNMDSLLVEYNGPDTEGQWKAIGNEALMSSPDAASRDLDFIIHPNPVIDRSTHVTLRNGTGEPVTITVINSLGQKLREFIFPEGGRSTFALSDMHFEVGVYLIVITQGTKTSSQRMIYIH